MSAKLLSGCKQFGIYGLVALSVFISGTLPAGGGALERTNTLPILGRQIEEFSLEDYRGKPHRLSNYSDSPILVVAFLGTECPLAKLYAPRLQSLADQFADQGVTIIGINANSQDSLTEMAAYARRHGAKFALLKDAGNHVTDLFGATRTPEVFVLDAERTVRYHGRIDDQYGVGYGREKPEQQDLKSAIEDLLAGRPVEIAETTAVGCLIGRARQANDESPVTYSNQVARLLNKHCVECHREGEIAPFELTSYEEVSGWADMMEEVVRTQRMPPWHANPEHGGFANARGMSEEEKELLYEWVRQGAPEGNPADLPSMPEYVTGWRLPQEPDLVVDMRREPFTVPAEGVIEYQYFAVDPEFEEDMWVKAADVVPGSRAAVHHVIVFISPPENKRRRGMGFLAAYVPGQSAFEYAPGQGRLIPAGSKLIFQMHYTPIGSEVEDMSKLGLVFAKPDEVKEEVVSLIAINEKFEIPPHAKNHRVDATRDHWPTDATLLSMAPHMHLRGKAFRVTGRWPDGKEEILLDVPNYDFNWQNGYALADPLAMPKDFELLCTAHYDNSVKNLANPDPSSAVRWGDQTWDEMMIAFFDVAVPRDSLDKREKKKPREITDEQRQEARDYARDFLQRFDTNSDGVIKRKEAPRSLAVFAFWQFDANDDKALTEDEIYEEALRDLTRDG